MTVAIQGIVCERMYEQDFTNKEYKRYDVLAAQEFLSRKVTGCRFNDFMRFIFIVKSVAWGEAGGATLEPGAKQITPKC